MLYLESLAAYAITFFYVSEDGYFLSPTKNPATFYCPGFLDLKLAERTGLEPATPGVTGRYSDQLNYRSNDFLLTAWWVL